jgi:hypothetical protein
MNDSKKITFPEGVVDKEAYKKYLAYTKHPILKNKYITTSDGETLNLGMLQQFLKKMIAHLAPKEQEVILLQKHKYAEILAKKSAAKGKAFGTLGRKGKMFEEKIAMDVTESDIMELLGRMFTVAEVVRIMGEDNGICITEQDVRKVLKHNIVEIERKREEFRNKVTDVRLYNKRPRLEELAWMYSKMKMRYVSSEGVIAYNAMLRTLEQLRKESEGDIINVNGALDINLNAEINVHIQKEILKTINLKEIILGRVAARMNYDPEKLIAGLHNSYYNKFVQISGDFDEQADMKYPSLINYDFNEIEKRNAQVNDIVDVEAEPVKEEEHQKAQSIKELFLSKIRKQKAAEEQKTSSYVNDDPTKFNVKEDYSEVERRKSYAGWNDKRAPSKTKGTGKKL